MIRRLPAAMLAASLLLFLASGLASAGGWATIVPDDPAPPEPRAGEEVEFGFTVLQHGETPINWDQPTLRLTNLISGEVIETVAVASGPAGHFVARITAPEAGTWLWYVDLRDLLVETPPVAAVVLEADGSQPALGLGEVLAAMHQTREEATEAIRSEVQPRIDQLEAQVSQLQARGQGLHDELTKLRTERDQLATTSTDGPIPPLGVVTLAVLAGAIAGFIVAWLGGRRPPAEADATALRHPVPTS